MATAVLMAVLYGILEGVTEWLPVSSTGHIILLDAVLPLPVTPAFYDLFEILIQLGAIMAVLVLYGGRLNPLDRRKTPLQRKNTLTLWGKVLLGVLPSAVLGLAFDEKLDTFLRNTSICGTNLNTVTVALALIFYGGVFLLLERRKRVSARPLTFLRAAGIGLFQCLAIIPGTSRSGATILGALLLGVSRPAAAEYSFFLAIPTMLGAGLLKLWQARGVPLTGQEFAILLTGCLTAFFVSLPVLRGLMNYVKTHDFSPFGIYRILLGAAVLGYFLH